MTIKSIFTIRALFVLSILLLIAFTTAFYVPFTSSNLQTHPVAARTQTQLQAAAKIMNVSSEFYVLDTMFASIRFTETDAPFIPAISGSISLFYPLLLADFGLTLEEAGRLDIVVFPDQPSLEAAMGRRYTYVPMGVFFAGIINIISPTVWITGTDEEITERFMREGPVIHEMVHFVLDVKTNGNYPLWFTEGVALFYEYKYAAFEWRPDLRYTASHLCATDVSANFRDFCETLSYRKVFDIIMYYIKAHGENGLQEIIAELGRGVPHAEVLVVVLENYIARHDF